MKLNEIGMVRCYLCSVWVQKDGMSMHLRKSHGVINVSKKAKVIPALPGSLSSEKTVSDTTHTSNKSYVIRVSGQTIADGQSFVVSPPSCSSNVSSVSTASITGAKSPLKLITTSSGSLYPKIHLQQANSSTTGKVMIRQSLPSSAVPVVTFGSRIIMKSNAKTMKAKNGIPVAGPGLRKIVPLANSSLLQEGSIAKTMNGVTTLQISGGSILDTTNSDQLTKMENQFNTKIGKQILSLGKKKSVSKNFGLEKSMNTKAKSKEILSELSESCTGLLSPEDSVFKKKLQGKSSESDVNTILDYNVNSLNTEDELLSPRTKGMSSKKTKITVVDTTKNKKVVMNKKMAALHASYSEDICDNSDQGLGSIKKGRGTVGKQAGTSIKRNKPKSKESEPKEKVSLQPANKIGKVTAAKKEICDQADLTVVQQTQVCTGGKSDGVQCESTPNMLLSDGVASIGENESPKSGTKKKRRKQVLKPVLEPEGNSNIEMPITSKVKVRKKGKRSSIDSEAFTPTVDVKSNPSPSVNHKKYSKRFKENAIDTCRPTPKTSRQFSRGGRGGWKKKRPPGRPRKIQISEATTPDLSEIDSLFDGLDNEDIENEPFVMKLKEDENIPTVELDLFTLPSLNEHISVLLTDPHNPDFKVYASMDAIFVGDSALGDVTNQIGYVTDANNVVFVNPGHFLFPNVQELDKFVPSPILTMKEKVPVCRSPSKKICKINTGNKHTAIVCTENKLVKKSPKGSRETNSSGKIILGSQESPGSNKKKKTSVCGDNSLADLEETNVVIAKKRTKGKTVDLASSGFSSKVEKGEKCFSPKQEAFSSLDDSKTVRVRRRSVRHSGENEESEQLLMSLKKDDVVSETKNANSIKLKKTKNLSVVNDVRSEVKEGYEKKELKVMISPIKLEYQALVEQLKLEGKKSVKSRVALQFTDSDIADENGVGMKRLRTRTKSADSVKNVRLRTLSGDKSSSSNYWSKRKGRLKSESDVDKQQNSVKSPRLIEQENNETSTVNRTRLRHSGCERLQSTTFKKTRTVSNTASESNSCITEQSENTVEISSENETVTDIERKKPKCIGSEEVGVDILKPENSVAVTALTENSLIKGKNSVITSSVRGLIRSRPMRERRPSSKWLESLALDQRYRRVASPKLRTERSSSDTTQQSSHKDMESVSEKVEKWLPIGNSEQLDKNDSKSEISNVTYQNVLDKCINSITEKCKFESESIVSNLTSISEKMEAEIAGEGVRNNPCEEVISLSNVDNIAVDKMNMNLKANIVGRNTSEIITTNDSSVVKTGDEESGKVEESEHQETPFDVHDVSQSFGYSIGLEESVAADIINKKRKRKGKAKLKASAVPLKAGVCLKEEEETVSKVEGEKSPEGMEIAVEDMGTTRNGAFQVTTCRDEGEVDIGAKKLSQFASEVSEMEAADNETGEVGKVDGEVVEVKVADREEDMLREVLNEWMEAEEAVIESRNADGVCNKGMEVEEAFSETKNVEDVNLVMKEITKNVENVNLVMREMGEDDIKSKVDSDEMKFEESDDEVKKVEDAVEMEEGEADSEIDIKQYDSDSRIVADDVAMQVEGEGEKADSETEGKEVGNKSVTEEGDDKLKEVDEASNETEVDEAENETRIEKSGNETKMKETDKQTKIEEVDPEMVTAEINSKTKIEKLNDETKVMEDADIEVEEMEEADIEAKEVEESVCEAKGMLADSENRLKTYIESKQIEAANSEREMEEANNEAKEMDSNYKNKMEEAKNVGKDMEDADNTTEEVEVVTETEEMECSEAKEIELGSEIKGMGKANSESREMEEAESENWEILGEDSENGEILGEDSENGEILGEDSENGERLGEDSEVNELDDICCEAKKMEEVETGTEMEEVNNGVKRVGESEVEAVKEADYEGEMKEAEIERKELEDADDELELQDSNCEVEEMHESEGERKEVKAASREAKEVNKEDETFSVAEFMASDTSEETERDAIRKEVKLLGSPKASLCREEDLSHKLRGNVGSEEMLGSPTRSKDGRSSKKITGSPSSSKENLDLSQSRQWLGRGAKLKAQVLIQDQQTGVTDSHIVSSSQSPSPDSKKNTGSQEVVGSPSKKEKINLSITMVKSPKSPKNSKSIGGSPNSLKGGSPNSLKGGSPNSLKVSRSPKLPRVFQEDREWQARGAKLKAQIMITDQQTGQTNTRVETMENRCFPSSFFGSPPLKKVKLESPPANMKDIRSFFRVQKSPPHMGIESSDSGAVTPEPCSSSKHSPHGIGQSSKPGPQSMNSSIKSSCQSTSSSSMHSLQSINSSSNSSPKSSTSFSKPSPKSINPSKTQPSPKGITSSKIQPSPKSITSSMTQPSPKSITSSKTQPSPKSINSSKTQPSPKSINSLKTQVPQSVNSFIKCSPQGSRRRKVKLYSVTSSDIRTYFSPDSGNKRKSEFWSSPSINKALKTESTSPDRSPKTEDVSRLQETQQSCESLVTQEPMSSLPNPLQDFEGFQISSKQSALRARSLMRLVSLLENKRWYGTYNFPFPVDQLCDWDDDMLNNKVFDKNS